MPTSDSDRRPNAGETSFPPPDQAQPSSAPNPELHQLLETAVTSFNHLLSQCRTIYPFIKHWPNFGCESYVTETILEIGRILGEINDEQLPAEDRRCLVEEARAKAIEEVRQRFEDENLGRKMNREGRDRFTEMLDEMVGK